MILGVAFGVVLALTAGARRADTAVERFIDSSNAFDLIVVQGVPGVFDFAPVDLDAVVALPGVTESTERVTLAVSAITSDGVSVDSSQVNFNTHPDGAYGTTINRYKVLHGRRADPTDPTEVVVPFRSAEPLDLDVGDSIRANFLDPEELRSVFDPTAPEPATLDELDERGELDELRVVGIVAAAGELGTGIRGAEISNVEMTPAAFEAYGYSAVVHSVVLQVEGGTAGVAPVLDQVEALGGGQPVLTITQTENVRSAEQAISPVVRALWLAAALLTLVVLLIGGQILARQAAAEGTDDVALLALGTGRRQFLALRVAKAAVIAVPTAVVAAGVALALSPSFPVGLARLAEPDPGLSVDGTVFALGGILVVLTLAALAGLSGWWRSRRSRRRAAPAPAHRASRLVGAIARSGAPPTAVAGSRMAVQPGSDTVMSLRTSAAAVALGLGTVAAVIVFTASLDHLRSSPALYGWNWDVTLGQDFATTIARDQLTFLRADDALEALAVGDDVTIGIEGEDRTAYAVDPVLGSIEPALLDGRAPTGVGEIVVAPGVADVGDRVEGSVGGQLLELEVVGGAVLPGAEVFTSFETLQRLTPDVARQIALVRFVPGADVDAFFARLHEPPMLYTDEDIEQPRLSEDLVNFGRVDRMPVLVGGLMGLVAVATLAHALVLTVRRRRHDLAILKAIGFTRRQVVATTAWQASFLSALAAVLALPLGIVAGRLAWLRYAGDVKVVPVALVPAIALVVLVIGAVVVANVVALAPAWRAARTPPGTALRAE